MHRCKHAYEIKFHPFSEIRAECTLCQDIVRLRKRYAVLGYSIGFIICSFLLMLFEHLIDSSWLILPLIPSLLLVYVFISWLMYFRLDFGHPLRSGYINRYWHMQIGPVNHVLISPVIPID